MENMNKMGADSLTENIPNVYLGLGFEFGPQRFRDLAFVCPYSLVRGSD